MGVDFDVEGWSRQKQAIQQVNFLLCLVSRNININTKLT